MRKGAGSWIAKIFIALLVLSFAVWGIADIFGGVGARPLATIGDRKITEADFQEAYQSEMQRLAARFGRRLTSEQARLLGVHQRVLARLVGFAAMDSHASDLGLDITDEAIAETITREPAFRGPDGRFDRRRFEETLRANGLSELGYVYRQRSAQIRAQIRASMLAEPALPDPLLEAINQFQNEARALAHFRLPLAKAGKVDPPDEAALKTYYEENKQAFRAPEYRKLSLLVLTVDSVKSRITVSEADIKAYYESHADSYNTPERRRIEQIFFPDLDAAKRAWKDLEAGKSFLEVAKAAGLKKSDMDLGEVTRKDLADPKVAEAAFSLKKAGDFSKPIEGELAVVIVRATKITPGVTRTLADVKDKVRESLAAERAEALVLDLYDKVEDERGAGATLEEVAKKLKLDHVLIEATDLRGNGPDGKPVKGLPKRRGTLLRTAFEGDVGVELDPVDLPGGGFAWVDVLDVTPERVKTFEEVKGEARKRYIAEAERRALAKAARELVARIEKGETIEAVAKSMGARVETSKPLKRSEVAKGLPRAAVQRAFALPRHGAASAALPGGKARVVFQVVAVTPAPALTPKAAEALRGRLEQELRSDLLAEYVGALQRAYDVRINETVFARVTGQTGS